jgi:outer membrane protein OmpA-like peptidoglycan-associated protein
MMTKNNLKLGLSIALTAALGAGLASCSHEKKMTVAKVVKPSVYEIRAKLEKQIKQDKVQVIRVGQTIRLVLSSDYFFQPNSANLYKKQVEVLARIAHYIGTFHQSEVAIKGYTANTFASHYQQALSAKQAEVVSHRMWRMGIKSQLLIATGLGEKGAVDSNKTAEGRFANNRVEISFMYRADMPLYD